MNHRSSLGEHVLIKDNHIAAAGSLTKAVKLARLALAAAVVMIALATVWP